MKVIILTLGSRGDVQPYVALGTGLINKGHTVTICTGKTFQSFIESHGIFFKEASLDFMEILKTEEGQEMFNGGKNIFKILKYTQAVINPGFRKTYDDFLESAKGHDVIVYHPKATVAPDIAELLGISCVSMPPVPMTYPISEFPNLAVSGTRNFGIFNKLTYKVNQFAESSLIKAINDFRTTHGLKKRKMGAYTYELNGNSIPIIYPVSGYLFEDVASWNKYVHLTGFFYLPSKNMILEEKVKSFIQQGSRPIVISFSSMPLKNPEQFKELLLKALRKTKNRGIILTGNSGIMFESSDMLLCLEKAPHRLLFKESKGILHHGGVGTMAEALLSGQPQVIMPFNVDQPFWAHRLYQQGLALKPLREKTLTLDDLTRAFISMDGEEIKDSARTIAKKLNGQNGIENCVKLIESIVGE